MDVVSLAPELGARLRAARQARGQDGPQSFSLRAVAGRLGVSAAYLSLVETGRQRPTEALLRALDRLKAGRFHSSNAWVAIHSFGDPRLLGLAGATKPRRRVDCQAENKEAP